MAADEDIWILGYTSMHTERLLAQQLKREFDQPHRVSPDNVTGELSQLHIVALLKDPICTLRGVGDGRKKDTFVLIFRRRMIDSRK